MAAHLLLLVGLLFATSGAAAGTFTGSDEQIESLSEPVVMPPILKARLARRRVAVVQGEAVPPEDARVLAENEQITADNIDSIGSTLVQLCGVENLTGWQAEFAVESAGILRKEYKALAEIHEAQGDARPHRTYRRHIQRVENPLDLNHFKVARCNFLLTKANLVLAEELPDSGENLELARQRHAEADSRFVAKIRRGMMPQEEVHRRVLNSLKLGVPKDL